MSGFQGEVFQQPAPAVEGDFASANPRATLLAGPGALVAGSNGVTVGKFAWVGSDFRTTNSFGTNGGAPDGFVHRDQQGLIETYLQIASMQVPTGFPVTLHNAGDFWARNLGPAALTKGATVYAGYADGGIYSSAPAGASATATIGSTNTAALGSTSTGTVVEGQANEITISSVTGVISIGDTISGTGIPTGTTVVSQISGTTGGAGVYELSEDITSSDVTVTTFGDTVVVSSTTGLISIGDTVSGGAGFPVDATVVAQLSGTTGGAGTYQLSAPGTAYTASATGVTTFGFTMNVTAVGSGSLSVGQAISGTGIPSSTNIASQLTGAAGSTGLYTISNSATAYETGITITTLGGIATGWKAMPTSPGDGAVGALVKITTYGV